MTSRPVVVLSGDEGTGTLAAVRGLHAAGFAVWLAVSRQDTYAARSRRLAGVASLTDPGQDQARHAGELAALARRTAAAAVLPGTEGSLRAVTGREDVFPPEAALGTSPQQALDRATDKRLLADLAGAAGLEVVPTATLSELDLDQVIFPAVLKPMRSVLPRGRGLRGAEAERVDSREPLEEIIAAGEAAEWVVQPYLEGTLGAVCGVAWRGEVVCAVHQVSPRIWPPHAGISSYAVTVPADAQREAGVRMLVRSLDWSGVFGVQFLLSAHRAYVIDFNPRIYGSLALAIAAGANLPAVWAQLLLGREAAAPGYRPGVRYRAEEDDYRALLHEFRAGRRGEAFGGLLPRRNTVHAVFDRHDPAPSLLSIQKVVKRLRLP